MAVLSPTRSHAGPPSRWSRPWHGVLDAMEMAVPQLLILGLVAFAGAETAAPHDGSLDQPPRVVVVEAR